MAGWVPARAVLALLLWVADGRAVCVLTWVVLTCGCRDGAEVDVNDAPDEVKQEQVANGVARALL